MAKFKLCFRRGLYISDIPLHDATRDLVLMSEQFEADYKLTRNLEFLTDKLQQTYRELEGEKQKTDRYLLYFNVIRSSYIFCFKNNAINQTTPLAMYLVVFI